MQGDSSLDILSLLEKETNAEHRIGQQGESEVDGIRDRLRPADNCGRFLSIVKGDALQCIRSDPATTRFIVMRQGHCDLVDRQIIRAEHVGQSEAKVLSSAESNLDRLANRSVGEYKCVSCLVRVIRPESALDGAFHFTPGWYLRMPLEVVCLVRRA